MDLHIFSKVCMHLAVVRASKTHALSIYACMFRSNLDPRPIRLQLNARSPPRPGILIVSGKELRVIGLFFASLVCHRYRLT